MRPEEAGPVVHQPRDQGLHVAELAVHPQYLSDSQAFNKEKTGCSIYQQHDEEDRGPEE